MKLKYKILGIIILVLIAIQFISYGNEHRNPSVVSEPNWDNPNTRELFFSACSDCHSNETKWPWYNNVAPISWLIQQDVNEGREHFNVSMWGAQNENEGDKAADEVKEKEMPPWLYGISHSDAKLSESESKEFIKGLMETFGEDNERNENEEEND